MKPTEAVAMIDVAKFCENKMNVMQKATTIYSIVLNMKIFASLFQYLFFYCFVGREQITI